MDFLIPKLQKCIYFATQKNKLNAFTYFLCRLEFQVEDTILLLMNEE